MNSPENHISVIIPAYNAERYLAETVNSVITQSYTNWELIIVEDGSKDRTLQIANSFQEKDPRISVIAKQNGGVSSARNIGIENSQGEFLAFLDADDVWLPDNLEKKLQLLLDNPDLGLVHSDAEIIDENSHPTGNNLSGKEGNLLKDLLEWEGTSVPAPSSVLVPKEIINTAGLFDPKLSTAADKDFFIRVAEVYEIGRVPHVTWQYRVHSDNMHANIALMEHDELLVYSKAKARNLFPTKKIEKQCFAKMYLILSGSWWVYKRNFWKAAFYFIKAFLLNPTVVIRKYRP